MNSEQANANIDLIDEESFQLSLEGGEVELFTLRNKNGLTTQITNLGGKVVNLFVPDREGNTRDVVLGYDSPESYWEGGGSFYGTLIGRYGNRIGAGTFSIGNETYQLAKNNGENHLHGGPGGFHNVVWTTRKVDDQTLELNYLSPDGEEGYPGNLDVRVVYTLTDDNELKIEYWATTDKPTVVNLTHHSFFNLKGAGEGDINDHILHINADQITPVDSGLIPTGKLADVAGTPMDFREPESIGSRLDDEFEQLSFGGGYDHNYVLNSSQDELNYGSRVYSEQSGIVMEVLTNEPGLQFYGGNFMDGSDVGKGGKTYAHRGAFCLETQHFPDSPNKPEFPSTLLEPGDEYYSICIYRFSVLEE